MFISQSNNTVCNLGVLRYIFSLLCIAHQTCIVLLPFFPHLAQIYLFGFGSKRIIERSQGETPNLLNSIKTRKKNQTRESVFTITKESGKLKVRITIRYSWLRLVEKTPLSSV